MNFKILVIFIIRLIMIIVLTAPYLNTHGFYEYRIHIVGTVNSIQKIGGINTTKYSDIIQSDIIKDIIRNKYPQIGYTELRHFLLLAFNIIHCTNCVYL